MKRVLLIVALMAFISMKAQPPKSFYTKIGGSGEDIGYSVKQTLDRQYIVVGSTTSFGSTDAYLIKVDSMGLPIWSKTIGGVNFDVGKSVIQLPDSGYVIAGFTNSFGNGGYDAYIVRTDKNGNLIWQKTFGGSDWDFANDVVLMPNGGIVVVGKTRSFGNGQNDGMALMYDYNGNLLWQKFYGGVENDELKSVIKTNDGYIATVGYTESYSDSLGDHYFLKLNLFGDTLFTKKFGNSGKSYLNDLVQHPNGDFILVGAETYTNLPFTQSYRAHVTSVGNIVWQGNSFTSDDEEGWISVTKTLAGSPRTSTLRDFYKNGFKKQGSIFSNVWGDFYPTDINEFGGSEDEHLYSHEGTRDGGFICVGSTLSFGSNEQDIYLIKLDSIINIYPSIVSIPRLEEKNTKPLIKVTESLIQILFNSNPLPDNIEIFNIEGKLFKTLRNLSETVDVEKHIFDNSLYIFKFNYRDQTSFVTKILIR